MPESESNVDKIEGREFGETAAIEFTYAELMGLIDTEEACLAGAGGWNVGDPHPEGEEANNACEKVRAAFTQLYQERQTRARATEGRMN